MYKDSKSKDLQKTFLKINFSNYYFPIFEIQIKFI